jgi:hypothetical protein
MDPAMALAVRETENLTADRGPELSATTTALLVLASLFLGLRFWARRTVAAKFGLDDWMTAAAMVGFDIRAPSPRRKKRKEKEKKSCTRSAH